MMAAGTLTIIDADPIAADDSAPALAQRHIEECGAPLRFALVGRDQPLACLIEQQKDHPRRNVVTARPASRHTRIDFLHAVHEVRPLGNYVEGGGNLFAEVRREVCSFQAARHGKRVLGIEILPAVPHASDQFADSIQRGSQALKEDPVAAVCDHLLGDALHGLLGFLRAPRRRGLEVGDLRGTRGTVRDPATQRHHLANSAYGDRFARIRSMDCGKRLRLRFARIIGAERSHRREAEVPELALRLDPRAPHQRGGGVAPDERAILGVLRDDRASTRRAARA
jgi:hypothetical protein